ncbi:MAG: MBOAT family protein, partial [Candidatus Krumholzibacteriota bacterium]|nr:MBOAT family protein [Candidatus Krumholzibacteriota bacterium]
NLLPQFERLRTITREALDTGAWLIVWGLFKKIVIADNLAAIADPVFDGSAGATSLMVYFGTIAFAFQIYCDFSGYSDIARGLARVLGFELMLNFNLPYFARNPQDFWRRWHISLSTWLRDYLYIPLGGSRGGHWATNRNLLATMLLGGLWHGASWNFLWWGAFHGLILVAHREIVQRQPARRVVPAAWRLFASRVATFHLVLFGWLLFRSTRRVEGLGISGDDSFRQITELLGAQANGFGLDAASLATAGRILLYVLPLLAMQWWQNRSDDHCVLLKQPWILRSSVYAAMAVFWLLGARQESNAFIYFQF